MLHSGKNKDRITFSQSTPLINVGISKSRWYDRGWRSMFQKITSWGFPCRSRCGTSISYGLRGQSFQWMDPSTYKYKHGTLLAQVSWGHQILGNSLAAWKNWLNMEKSVLDTALWIQQQQDNVIYFFDSGCHDRFYLIKKWIKQLNRCCPIHHISTLQNAGTVSVLHA